MDYAILLSEYLKQNQSIVIFYFSTLYTTCTISHAQIKYRLTKTGSLLFLKEEQRYMYLIIGRDKS
jgi:hypothetical protein